MTNCSFEPCCAPPPTLTPAVNNAEFDYKWLLSVELMVELHAIQLGLWWSLLSPTTTQPPLSTTAVARHRADGRLAF